MVHHHRKNLQLWLMSTIKEFRNQAPAFKRFILSRQKSVPKRWNELRLGIKSSGSKKFRLELAPTLFENLTCHGNGSSAFSIKFPNLVWR